MKAIKLLNDKLKGTFISRFSLGDTWSLNLGDYWLSAQSLISQDETFINEWLSSNYQPFGKAIDKENVSKCAILAAYMRKEIVGLNLNDACSLIIDFGDNGKLVLPTNTETVDWQWCLSEADSDPYQDYIIACFWEGEIEINDEKKA